MQYNRVQPSPFRMNVSKKIIAGVSAALYLCAASPAMALTFTGAIEASNARCNQLAGREKARCININKRVERLRLRQTTNTYQRGSTQREQRVLARQQNHERNSTERIRGFDMNRLRSHNRDGGNARRLINSRDEQARGACRLVDATEKSECIRMQWKGLRRGNTR